jgi:hypothetical protein
MYKSTPPFQICQLYFAPLLQKNNQKIVLLFEFANQKTSIHEISGFFSGCLFRLLCAYRSQSRFLIPFQAPAVFPRPHAESRHRYIRTIREDGGAALF